MQWMKVRKDNREVERAVVSPLRYALCVVHLLRGSFRIRSNVRLEGNGEKRRHAYIFRSYAFAPPSN